MAKKLADKTKVERSKTLALRALEEIRTNSNRTEALAAVTTLLSQIYATLDLEKDDEFAYTNLWVAIHKEVYGGPAAQLELPLAITGRKDKR